MKTVSQIAVFLLSCGLILSSCGKAEKEPQKSNPLSPNQKGGSRVVSLTSCAGDITNKGSIYKNPWMDMRMTEKNVLVTDTLTFKPGKLFKQTVCAYRNQFVELNTQAEIAVSENINEFQIIKGDKVTGTLKVGNVEYPCESMIAAQTEPVVYEFAGNCLYVRVTEDQKVSYPPGLW